MTKTVDCNPVYLTDEQRANLATLAAYLRALPADYADFDMGLFTTDARAEAHIIKCGTSACAVGHGPKAGIAGQRDEDWSSYSNRVFIDGNSKAWDWCFSGCWDDVDNTVHGAAARIEFMLANGCPEDAAEQEMGEAPLCYSTDRLQA